MSDHPPSVLFDRPFRREWGRVFHHPWSLLLWALVLGVFGFLSDAIIGGVDGALMPGGPGYPGGRPTRLAFHALMNPLPWVTVYYVWHTLKQEHHRGEALDLLLSRLTPRDLFLIKVPPIAARLILITTLGFLTKLAIYFLHGNMIYFDPNYSVAVIANRFAQVVMFSLGAPVLMTLWMTVFHRLRKAWFPLILAGLCLVGLQYAVRDVSIDEFSRWILFEQRWLDVESLWTYFLLMGLLPSLVMAVLLIPLSLIPMFLFRRLYQVV